MNNVVLLGRLTKDVEVRKTQTNESVVSFTLAINRRFKNSKGEYDADFINCVAWKQSADYLAKYSHKGDLVALNGTIQTRTYDAIDGRKYITEVNADYLAIVSPKSNQDKVDTQNENIVVNEEKKPQIEITPDDLPFF